MKIIDALKNSNKTCFIDMRISIPGKFMIWDIDKWVVYDSKFSNRVSKAIFETQDEDLAVEKLLED